MTSPVLTQQYPACPKVPVCQPGCPTGGAGSFVPGSTFSTASVSAVLWGPFPLPAKALPSLWASHGPPTGTLLLETAL